MTLSATPSHVIGLHPLDGPRAIVRVDPAPGFASMSNNDSLKHLNVTIEVGRVKNKNKNPVAEKAVRELEEELIRQEPGGCPVSEIRDLKHRQRNARRRRSQPKEDLVEGFVLGGKKES